MKLRIFHRTSYQYRMPVRSSYNELRLRPATEDADLLGFFLINIQPPVRLRHYRDNFFNYVHYFEITEPHQRLVVESQCVMRTSTDYSDGAPLGVPFARLEEIDLDVLQMFLGTSRYVEHSPDIWKLALDVRDDREGIFETAEAIMHHIYANWTYAPNTTTASTHVSEVFATRRGVCQDFAHLMIGLCRALRIPARYVSGYIYDNSNTLRGASASHAWCEVHVPGRGWFGLDPTNDTLADERHLKIATGRDYHDAAPISGHFDGPHGATSALEVQLEIERLDG